MKPLRCSSLGVFEELLEIPARCLSWHMMSKAPGVLACYCIYIWPLVCSRPMRGSARKAEPRYVLRGMTRATPDLSIQVAYFKGPQTTDAWGIKGVEHI